MGRQLFVDVWFHEFADSFEFLTAGGQCIQAGRGGFAIYGRSSDGVMQTWVYKDVWVKHVVVLDQHGDAIAKFHCAF